MELTIIQKENEAKAQKWDALKEEMSSIFFDESNTEALDILGETACIHLGFYGS
tara:strand:- start:6889 stop:7050 length:162 start_codon:yes stop_codon:yes gene_type:complete